VATRKLVILLTSKFNLGPMTLMIAYTIAELGRRSPGGTCGQAADEQTVIFGACLIPKSLYLADAYCIAFRK
jgi:hypothetical protein